MNTNFKIITVARHLCCIFGTVCSASAMWILKNDIRVHDHSSTRWIWLGLVCARFLQFKIFVPIFVFVRIRTDVVIHPAGFYSVPIVLCVQHEYVHDWTRTKQNKKYTCISTKFSVYRTNDPNVGRICDDANKHECFSFDEKWGKSVVMVCRVVNTGEANCSNPHVFPFLRSYDDVIKWKYFPRYWPFVRGIHRSLVNSPHKD